MRSFFAGRDHRRTGNPDSVDLALQQPRQHKSQPDSFNRILFYLFPNKSQADSSLPPSRPPPTHHQRPLQTTRPALLPAPTASASRPTTATSVSDMHIPHHTLHPTNGELPLDIVLHDSPVILRGTGVDIEPAIIRGTVCLSLPEATDIRVIEIRCTGKARVTVLLKEGTRSQPQTSLFYAKDIDLLQGDKSHPHTLKAGRHEFPFTFEIDAKSPASLTANFGMATIDWRLRATAIRPSFSTNFTSTKVLTVVRSFGTEALEFQQTLEIENVWPEKINYAVILPHKAWAAGDHISAILKFTPLVKGVKVVSVKMQLQEKVKTVWKSLAYEDIRDVCSKKETLSRAGTRRRSSDRQTPSPPHSPGGGAADHDATLQQHQRRGGPQPAAGQTAPTSFFRRVGSRVHSRENLLGLFRARTGEEASEPTAAAAAGDPNTSAAEPTSPVAESPSPRRSEEEWNENSEDVEMILRMRIPTDATPSHSIVPVIVSHRVKWEVLICNPDGHHSELRCSLPVHVLAKEVLEETLAATNATRTALLGESHGVQVQEIVLPAYHDHMRDRVAIVELHDHTLATNPLNSSSIPTSPEDAPSDALGTASSSYGPTSTLGDQMGRSNVPRVASMPDASDRGRMRRMLGFNGPADAHSSELYLSLGRQPDTANSAVTTPPEIGSHPASQSSSRASSPERSGEASSSSGGRHSRHVFNIRPFSVFSKNSNKAPSTPSSSRPGSSHKNPSSWSGLGHRQTLSRSSSGGPSGSSSPDGLSPLPLPLSRASTSPTRASTSSNLGEYYDAVPTYSFAAQGFLGGGITPLSSFRGLPSYDQAQRSRASSPQSTAITSITSITSQGSSTSSGSGSRRRSSIRMSRRASIANDQHSSLPPLPPSPTPSTSSH